MTNEQLIAKLREYPVSAVFTVLGLVAAVVSYLRWDVDAELISARELADRDLNGINQREALSRNLDKDVAQLIQLRERLTRLAMNFDDPIQEQSFFANFVQRAPVMAEGLPVPDALPSLYKNAEPFASGPYKTQVSADFDSALAYLRSINAQSLHPMVVRRVQMVSSPSESLLVPSITTDVLFNVWGRRGEFANIKSVADKTVMAPAVRRTKIIALEDLLSKPKVSSQISINPFGSFQSTTVGKKNENAPDVDQDLKDALNKISYSIEPFLGARSVKIPGAIPKRVGNDLEVKVGARIVKVRIHSIEDAGFTVLTVNGAKVTISPQK